jgi:hypothetical protein
MTMTFEQIRATLAQYGAKSATSGFVITRDSLPTGIMIKIAKGRMRFEDVDSGALYMSGPVRPETIESFVENFWFWSKQA